MLINLSELFTCEGKEKLYTPDIEMMQFHGPTGDFEIVKKEPVNIRARNVGDRTLMLEGEAKLTLAIPCDRCLDPVLTDFVLDISRSLDFKETEEERLENLDEQSYVDGYNLDVDQLVCNELLLNLPMKILCSENCKGICNRCGTNLNHGSCDCDTAPLDPRMSVIQDIFKQFKEV